MSPLHCLRRTYKADQLQAILDAQPRRKPNRRTTIEIPRETVADVMATLAVEPVKPLAKRCDHCTELTETQELPTIKE